MVTPAMRTTAVLLGFLKLDNGNEDDMFSFARFFTNLTNMASVQFCHDHSGLRK